MLALVKTQKGKGFMELREVPEPVIAADEVLIEVKAAGICGTDMHVRHDTFPYWPPVTMGHEFAGEIVDGRASMGHLELGLRYLAGFAFDKQVFANAGLGSYWPLLAWIGGGLTANLAPLAKARLFLGQGWRLGRDAIRHDGPLRSRKYYRIHQRNRVCLALLRQRRRATIARRVTHRI